MEGTWWQYARGCRWPGEGELRVVGKALQTQGPRSLGLPGYRSSLGCCLRLRQKGARFTPGPQAAASRAAGHPSAGVAAAPPKAAALSRAKAGAPPSPAVPLKSAPARTRLRGVPRLGGPRATLAELGPQKSLTLSARSGALREWPASDSTSWVSVALSDLWDVGGWGAERSGAEDPSGPPAPYLSLIRQLLKPQKPTRAAVRLLEKTVEATRLDKQIQEAQVRQKRVLEETRALLQEEALVQADTSFMLRHLSNKTEEYRRDIHALWDGYAREGAERRRRARDEVAQGARRTAELRTQLLEKEKKEFDLKRQLAALRDIALVRQKQDGDVRALQEELKQARAETVAKAYAEYLQEKALLEGQLGEPDAGLRGKRERTELRRRAQALEVAARRLALQCGRDLGAENRVARAALARQAQLCRQVRAACGRWQRRKQQLQQELWYIEYLARGRQRLQPRAPSPGTK